MGVIYLEKALFLNLTSILVLKLICSWLVELVIVIIKNRVFLCPFQGFALFKKVFYHSIDLRIHCPELHTWVVDMLELLVMKLYSAASKSRQLSQAQCDPLGGAEHALSAPRSPTEWRDMWDEKINCLPKIDNKVLTSSWLLLEGQIFTNRNHAIGKNTASYESSLPIKMFSVSTSNLKEH